MSVMTIEFVNSEWNEKTHGKYQRLIEMIACILLTYKYPRDVLIVWHSK